MAVFRNLHYYYSPRVATAFDMAFRRMCRRARLYYYIGTRPTQQYYFIGTSLQYFVGTPASDLLASACQYVQYCIIRH